MVCVTRQKACERLIAAGAGLAKRQDLGLTVVHVVHYGDNVLGSQSEGAALDYLFTIAKQYDAPIQMLRSDHVVQTLARFSQENHVTHIVMGRPSGEKGLIKELMSLLPQVEFHIDKVSNGKG